MLLDLREQGWPAEQMARTSEPGGTQATAVSWIQILFFIDLLLRLLFFLLLLCGSSQYIPISQELTWVCLFLAH